MLQLKRNNKTKNCIQCDRFLFVLIEPKKEKKKDSTVTT